MVRAVWNGTVLAESDKTEVVEGNHYFPLESVNREHLVDSKTTSFCPWKGTAKYCHVKVGDQVNEDAVWYYPSVKPEAKKFEGYYAFWKGVIIVE